MVGHISDLDDLVHNVDADIRVSELAELARGDNSVYRSVVEKDNNQNNTTKKR
jgi:hypothetical protein